ncbi:MAG: hypothetical protein ACRCU3_10225 [Eubacteriaceae bacterium]
MKNSTIILFPDKDGFWMEEMEKRNIKTYQIYKEHNLFLRIVRKVWMKLDFSGKMIWYGNWKKEDGKINTIIIFNILLDKEIVNYIYDKFEKPRIIIWHWDPISKVHIKPSEFNDRVCEQWSFDKKDCKNFNLKENTQFYFNNLKEENNKIKNDILFLGRNKGRMEILKKYENIFKEKNLKVLFEIISDKKYSLVKGSQNKFIPYARYLKMVDESKALFEIVQENQMGLTLRSLEALFFKKKLITNNISIADEKFYNKNNIHILEDGKTDEIIKFVNTPFQEVDEDKKNYFDFDQWVLRFMNN